jgi:enoyl-CoA hydratase/carnithine racemase
VLDDDVWLPDDAARRRVETAMARNPEAAAVLLDVLRRTEELSVDAALEIESRAYSGLLGGSEFGEWLGRRGPMPLPESGPEPVLLERDGDELLVTLNRPEVHNAYTAAMRDALVEALELALLDPVLQVTLRGAGRSFCSGGDLAEFGTTPDPETAHAIRMERSAARLLARLSARTTVQLKGACTGAGIELAAFGGHVAAAPRTFFRLPEVGMGLIPGAGGTVSIPRRIGRRRTAYLALTGVRLHARDALAWGLVDELVP